METRQIKSRSNTSLLTLSKSESSLFTFSIQIFTFPDSFLMVVLVDSPTYTKLRTSEGDLE